MTNTLYAKAKQAFLTKKIDLLEDNIKVALVDTTKYTAKLNSDEYYSHIVDAVVGAPQTLTNKTVKGGVFDADDITFPSVYGPPAALIVIYQDTGHIHTSRLIAYIDDAAGLAITPNGADIPIKWGDGPYKIFSI